MINIGSRRELFVDDYLIDTEKTTARLTMNKPVKREVVFVHDKPYECDIAVYHNILRRPDGKYVMYYKGHHYGCLQGSDQWRTLRKICVLFSDDGIHWERPELDIQPIPEAPVNNIINDEGYLFDNLFVFYDTNPNCPENERYKGVYGEWSTGLFCYKSADGLHFNWYDPDSLVMSGKETGCYFDSLNTIYWNADKGKYVAFVRGFHVGDDEYPPDPDVPDAKRDIRYSESEDFVHWSYPKRLKFNDDYDYQLYANAITQYYRAPHMWLSTPTRYNAREWCPNFESLTGCEERRTRGRGTSITDAIFMSSRDCENWYRFSEAMFTPGPEQPRNWIYGDCYPCVGMVETPGDVEGTDPYLSLYCKEDQGDKPVQLYRYTLRMDGFACIKSTFKPQKLVTKPFVFDGRELEINFLTSAAGWMKFTLEADDGTAIHSSEVFGDKIDRKVVFDDGDVASMSGKNVVMTVEMSDAELYSFKFNK